MNLLECTKQMDVLANSGGTLSGATILRFAHAFETGGGTESYLDDLDGALLARNAMTIVRLHLTRQPSSAPREEQIGQGRLIRIPLPILPGKHGNPDAGKNQFRSHLKQRIRDWVLYNPLIWSAIGARWTASFRLAPQPGQAAGAGNAAAKVFHTRQVNLVVLHFFGGADAEEVVNEARKFHVPFVLLNHFSNDRFLHLAIRKHTMQADGVAGVNGLGLPRYIQNHFTNLSDGINTDFFSRNRARPLENPPQEPIILLPARVVREKGQLDLVQATALLRQSGIECCLAFAGRVDSSSYLNELRQAIVRAGMSDSVRFLGALNVEELRDWYAASAIVALPTYHHEGLPRVILEAQAMGVPIVAYATGGVADGIKSGRTGYLLPTGDIRGLAHHLRELLASPSLRASMGRNGREAVENRFSLAALAGRHETFYLQTIMAPKAALIHAGAN